MTKDEFIQKVKSLNFPKGEYVVAGSGIMAAKEIREANDLDIVVTKKLFDFCNKEGSWELRPWTKKEILGKPWLKKEGVELMGDLYLEGKVIGATELIKIGEEIDGVDFISLEQLIIFKRAWGRPRDFEDIKLIENYLNSKNISH